MVHLITHAVHLHKADNGLTQIYIKWLFIKHQSHPLTRYVINIQFCAILIHKVLIKIASEARVGPYMYGSFADQFYYFFLDHLSQMLYSEHFDSEKRLTRKGVFWIIRPCDSQPNVQLNGVNARFREHYKLCRALWVKLDRTRWGGVWSIA